MACDGYYQCIPQTSDERAVSCYLGNSQEDLELLKNRRFSMLTHGSNLPSRLPGI